MGCRSCDAVCLAVRTLWLRTWQALESCVWARMAWMARTGRREAGGASGEASRLAALLLRHHPVDAALTHEAVVRDWECLRLPRLASRSRCSCCRTQQYRRVKRVYSRVLGGGAGCRSSVRLATTGARHPGAEPSSAHPPPPPNAAAGRDGATSGRGQGRALSHPITTAHSHTRKRTLR